MFIQRHFGASRIDAMTKARLLKHDLPVHETFWGHFLKDAKVEMLGARDMCMLGVLRRRGLWRKEGPPLRDRKF